MLSHRPLSISTAIAFVVAAVAACGDDNGVRSLDEFYGARASGNPSPSGTSTTTPGSSSVSSCDVSTTALLAHLPFDGNASLGRGSGFTATLDESPSFVTGRVGSALAGSSIATLRPSSTQSLSAWTVCAWIKMSSAPTALNVLEVSSEIGSTVLGVNGLTGSACATGRKYAPFVSGSNGCFASSQVSASTSWSFVCWASDSSNGQTNIHAGGSSESSPEASMLRLSPSGEIQVGSGNSGQSGSAIDELSIWGRALSSSEIERLGGGGSPCSLTTRGTR